MLVHVGDDGYDEQRIATAVKLAARKRRGIHVLVTITVPTRCEIDAPMPEAEAAADSIIEQAKLQGGGRVSGHWEKVRAGQAGRRIIEEAQDMRAAAVVMTLPRRVAGTSVFGKTIETVLAERPCRVIIESRPPVRRARGACARGEGAAMSPITAVLSGADGAARRGDDRARRSPAAAGRSPSGSCSGVLFVAAGAGRLWAERRR